MNLKTQILTLVNQKPGLSDREITDALLGQHVGQQAVNQACHKLEASGLIVREKIPNGRIGNYAANKAEPHDADEANPLSSPIEACDELSEDAVKRFLEVWLRTNGWTPTIAWGHSFGVDIEARSEARRWLIEVKRCGSRKPMRVNYFVAMLGELLQRMDDSNALYSIALPDLPQYRRLWNRLPTVAKERTGITALFIDKEGKVAEVE